MTASLNVLGSSSRSGWSRFSIGLAAALGLAACGGGGGSGDGTDDGADDGTGPDAGPDDGGDDGGDSPDGGPTFEQVPLIEGLTTLAGAGIPGSQDGDRDRALFNNPVNVEVDDDGSLIVADFDNSLVRRVTPAGDVSTLSVPPLEGMFVRPFGLAISGDTLYVQTDGNSLGQQGGAIWRMPVAGGEPELLRDNAGRCRGMVALSDGRLALTDFQAHVIQLFDPSSGTLTLLAGGMNAPGYRDGHATEASFDEPYDVVERDDGTLLVADFSNNRIRIVTLEGDVTTYAGTDTQGRDDGPLATATFYQPQGLAFDSAGNLYVTDTGNYLIRRITPAGEVSTVAGNASAGWADSEDPRMGQLFGIEGIDAGSDGYLYIADGTRGETNPHHRIRRLTLE